MVNLMAEDIATSSSGAGATPPTGSSATDAPTSAGAMPQKSNLTSEEALKARIAELERHAANKAEEAQRHGKNLSTAEKKLAEYEEKERLAQEATLSEIDKVTKRAQEVEQQLQQYKQKLIMAEVKLAANDFHNPEIAAKVIQDSLEFGDDGMPTNVKEALDALGKNNPFMLKPKEEKPAAPAPESPAQTAQKPGLQTPAIPAMNPGRSTIPAPGSLPPGRIPTLADVYKRQ